MRLNDEQIERYSRQLILAEVGPRGQERLGAARVAVVGTGPAAERVVAHLAAAGVGWIAADASLHAAVDPAQPDCAVATLVEPTDGVLDAAVVVGASLDAIARDVARWSTMAVATFWIGAGRAGALPPCPCCAAASMTASDTPAELTALRDTVLGTVVATEVAKTLLAIGTPLAGRVLAYDPATATVAANAVTARAQCAVCGGDIRQR